MNDKQMGGCGVLIALGVICLMCGGCGIGFMNGGYEYSEGYREGTVQKFSRKGMMFKTHEGELAMAGFHKKGTSENPTMSNVFEFTAIDPEVIKELESLHSTQQVRLHYKQYLCVPPWRGSSQYFIIRVEKIKD